MSKVQEESENVILEKATDISYKYLPVSVFDVEKCGKSTIRKNQNHNKTSSRSSYSPFPKDVAEWCAKYFLRDATFVFDPFAIVLLISANKAFDIISPKTKENIYGETIILDDINEEEAEKRMDIIGQNGNEGLHYENDLSSPGKTIIKS